MMDSSKYIFSNESLGSLTLDLERPSKKIYGDISLFNSCKVQGLTPLDPELCRGIHFFEWQRINYTYVVTDDHSISFPVELRVNDHYEKKSTCSLNNFHVLSGTINFKDSIGLSKLEIRDAYNRLIFSLETEVFPQKMDYKSDYKAMIEEISKVVRNLSFAMLKDTFRYSKSRKTGMATNDEWWNILDALFMDLVKQLSVIAKLAKHDIEYYIHTLPIERVHAGSKIKLQWFHKNQQFIDQKDVGLKVGKIYYSHAPSQRKYVTYDTWENRFIAWAIGDLISQLKNYRQRVETVFGINDPICFKPVIKRIKNYQGTLQGILHESPFKNAGKFEKRTHFSTSLNRGAGYRDFLRIYLLLTRGLELADNDIFKIGQKKISTLYEYWCFIKIIQLLNELNGKEITYQDLIKIKAGRIRVELEKGKESEVQFTDRMSGNQTTVFFNRSFRKQEKKSFTYTQLPDISVRFKKAEYDKPFWYLFDAKYRFDEDVNDNLYKVPDDAIGQLHRYRDAILHSDPGVTSYRRATKNLGGVILYPYPLAEREFLSNPFYKSLKEVNIGALPFLPGKTMLVKNLLSKLINVLPEEHYEQFIEMDQSDYKAKREKFSAWVTIGVVPSTDQAQRKRFIIKHSLFHIPFIKNLDSKIYLTGKFLLCTAGSKKATLYDVLSWEILTDHELKKLGATWNLRASKYIVFKLSKPLNELETPDAIAPLSYRYASMEGLRRYVHSKPGDTNYFYITNPDVARLYEEIRKIGIECKITWVINSIDPSLISISTSEIEIRSSINFPFLTFNIGDKFFDIKEVIELLCEAHSSDIQLNNN